MLALKKKMSGLIQDGARNYEILPLKSGFYCQSDLKMFDSCGLIILWLIPDWEKYKMTTEKLNI